MFKKIATPFFIFLFILIVPPFFYLFNYSDSITVSDKKIVYELPYPGILPDHPLYGIKKIRDSILEIITKTNIDKAKLFLLFSDKQIRMAEFLSKDKKTGLSIESVSNAETYASKIPSLLKKAKQQGDKPIQALVDQVRASNKKHKEIINRLISESQKGSRAKLEEALRLNLNIFRELGLLK